MTTGTAGRAAGFPPDPDRLACVSAYRALTTDPEPIVGATPPAAPLPRIPRSKIVPKVSDPDRAGEPLVDVTGPGIIDLAAYSRAGWPQAISRSIARRSAAEGLAGAAATLPEDYGLAVFDAWRPLALQAALYQQAYDGTDLEPGYVSPPALDPQYPPPHLTGGTFDLTLTFQGVPLALGTYFDEFAPRAALTALEDEPGPARQLRRLLAAAMTAAGFAPYYAEWWHWEYGTNRWAAARGTSPLYGACDG